MSNSGFSRPCYHGRALGSRLRSEAIEAKAVGAYLGLAVGDALGATVEFMTPAEIRAEHGEHREIVGGGWLCLRRGEVTDDTEMALALGRSIIARGAVDAHAAADAFDEWMRGRPKDIGNTVRRGLVGYRSTGLVEAPRSLSSAGNGACMRTLPVALATWGASAVRVMLASRAQAHITHNNELSDAGTETIVAMVQMSLDGATKNDLLGGPAERLWKAFPPFRFRGRREENPSGFVVHTLRAVLQAFFDTDTFEECVVDAVNRGGDADTTGAIAGMVAGAHYGREEIPRRRLRRLEPAVSRACTEQALALLALAPCPVVGTAAGELYVDPGVPEPSSP